MFVLPLPSTGTLASEGAVLDGARKTAAGTWHGAGYGLWQFSCSQGPACFQCSAGSSPVRAASALLCSHFRSEPPLYLTVEFSSRPQQVSPQSGAELWSNQEVINKDKFKTSGSDAAKVNFNSI